MTPQFRHSLSLLVMITAIVACLASVSTVRAQNGPSYPLFCHGGGSMKTEILTNGASVEVDTTFRWADQGAGTRPPKHGQCAWADRGPQGSEIKAGDTNFTCHSGMAPFHGIFGAGSATENSGENKPLRMAPIVVELPGAPQFRYIPGIVSDPDKFYKFMVYRDPTKDNCMHVTRFVGEVKPPFSPNP